MPRSWLFGRDTGHSLLTIVNEGNTISAYSSRADTVPGTADRVPAAALLFLLVVRLCSPRLSQENLFIEYCSSFGA